MKKSLKDYKENLPIDLKNYLEKLPSDVQEKAMKATSLEEFEEILSSANYEMTDEELEKITGGFDWLGGDPKYGDVREDFDVAKMPASFLSGEDLGF